MLRLFAYAGWSSKERMKKKDQFCSREYREFLEKEICLGCRGFGSDPHHTISRKWAAGSDALCIPLCRTCHNLIHAHKLSIPNIELETVRLQRKFLREQGWPEGADFEETLKAAGYTHPPFTRRKNRRVES